MTTQEPHSNATDINDSFSYSWKRGNDRQYARMGVGFQRRLRCTIVCIFSFVICQITILLVLVHFGGLEDVRARRLYPRDSYEWRNFIANTPARSDSFYQYNRARSDLLGELRQLPNTRADSCYKRSYAMPLAFRARVSVVISYHNEARSMLLRTIISLVRRTPAHYLHELIIIDDYSEDVSLLHELKSRMDNSNAPKLLFLRNMERMGMIWSRNKGASIASGHYLIFLDSHCEVNDGWLEPLLDRLTRNARLAVSPVLDRINPQTLTYVHGNARLKGGFDWSLHFHWLPRILKPKEPLERPYSSATFSGGIFMISRKWFLELQGFNQHLQIWGGESIEFAIKLWLCGGQIEIVPCSRIGHIFRRSHAFQFPAVLGDRDVNSAQATYLRNSKIIAEAWLDEYKYLFYALKPEAKHIPLNYSVDDLNHLKTVHHCASFDWYLRHVLKELKLENEGLKAMGTLRNDARCLHVEPSGIKTELLLQSCYQSGITTWFLRRENGHLQANTGLCLSVLLPTTLTLEPCAQKKPLQRWHRRSTLLVHSSTRLCLDNPRKNRVVLSGCRQNAPSQSFQFSLEMQTQT
ncbi:putative polypeptide N-acetylgalactosaminyltransferase 13 [Scaptodrosophila lebanonensis]|uniref:Polypeptide N-acetylgalactosaminyltransferase n=1 Tax=Drosophila lebanonensis TaxID=7225 RepID=A0A6J2T6L6_DROLE|nr:putative polypeptide N-acetylgalactosaminyltransferase 13 [Scaptodrosophila lebanonensis]